MDSALEELVAAYKTELGLSDKEADQLEHLQVSISRHNNPKPLLGIGAPTVLWRPTASLTLLFFSVQQR